jgi:hypothetical protein
MNFVNADQSPLYRHSEEPVNIASPPPAPGRWLKLGQEFSMLCISTA